MQLTQTQPDRSLLAALTISELTTRYAFGPTLIHPGLTSMSDAQLDRTFERAEGIGEWSCRVLIGHLIDAELAFTHRMRRIVAEEKPSYPAWNEEAFVKRHLYGKPGDRSLCPAGHAVELIRYLRIWTHHWLQSLSAEEFARTGVHTERGPQTVRDVLEYSVWHLEHHGWYLNRKAEKISGGK